MSTIVPTITTDNPEAYRDMITKYHVFSNHIHVDISDGSLAPNTLMELSRVWWPENWTVDIHLMAKVPSAHMDDILNLKPSLAILHAEVDEDITALLTILKKSGIRAGVALMKPTFPGKLTELIQIADHVMIFSGELGQQGGKASPMQVEKVHLIKEINPDVEIGWDGGVSVDNAFMISQAGVDVLNAGSAFANSEDPTAVYKSFLTELSRRGVV